MTEPVTLSALSDEPAERATSPTAGWPDFSPRLLAVLKRLPRNEVRIGYALMNANIVTLEKLQSTSAVALRRINQLGPRCVADIEAALATYGLQLAGVDRIEAGDHASAADPHVQRLQRWIEERLRHCDAEERRYGNAGAAHETTEREVLADVILILGGGEPTNKRRWSP